VDKGFGDVMDTCTLDLLMEEKDLAETALAVDKVKQVRDRDKNLPNKFFEQTDRAVLAGVSRHKMYI
jgi:hypothetical protein